jgi:hypothetical protein
MIFTLCENGYYPMLGEHLRVSLQRYKPIKNRLGERYENHDEPSEPSEAPKRRSRAIRQMKILRRRSVIGNVELNRIAIRFDL